MASVPRQQIKSAPRRLENRWSRIPRFSAYIDGDTIALSYFDERIEVSISGFVPGATPFATTLAAAITLVTAPTDYLKGSVGSLTVVESVTRTHSSEEYQRLEITAMNHSLVTA